jgi:hypothetical protein
MTKPQINLLGSIFAAGALAVAGCSGSSSNGGTGGKADGGGAGGAGGARATGGTTGTGGKTDGGTTDAGTAGTTGTTDGGDARIDAGTGGTTDARVDTGPVDTGPCITSFGAGNQVLFNFDNGVRTDWTARGLPGASVGSDSTSGHTCPGELSLTIPFTMYGDQSTDIGIGFTPMDWTAYAKLHVWVKLITSNYPAVNGVQSYLQSNGGYANSDVFVSGSVFADGNFHEVVFDLAHPNGTLTKSVVDRVGLQVLVQGALADGGFASAASVQVFLDDFWLEASPPPSDAGSDAVPAVDTGVDVPAATDVGADVLPTDTATDSPG